MAIKVALLVISALIAVAASYPSAAITSNEFDCNEHTIHEATLLGIKHDLNICFHSKCTIVLHIAIFSLLCYILKTDGKRCVKQRPFIAECPVSRPPQCTLFEWMNYDKYLKLNASICHRKFNHEENEKKCHGLCFKLSDPWGKGLCYRSKQSTIRCEAVPPPPAFLQQVEEWTEGKLYRK